MLPAHRGMLLLSLIPGAGPQRQDSDCSAAPAFNCKRYLCTPSFTLGKGQPNLQPSPASARAALSVVEPAYPCCWMLVLNKLFSTFRDMWPCDRDSSNGLTACVLISQQNYFHLPHLSSRSHYLRISQCFTSLFWSMLMRDPLGQSQLERASQCKGFSWV